MREINLGRLMQPLVGGGGGGGGEKKDVEVYRKAPSGIAA